MIFHTYFHFIFYRLIIHRKINGRARITVIHRIAQQIIKYPCQFIRIAQDFHIRLDLRFQFQIFFCQNRMKFKPDLLQHTTDIDALRLQLNIGQIKSCNIKKFIAEELLKSHGQDIAGKTCVVSGAGNVAIYAIQKAHQLGAKCVTCSDSTGWIYDPEGIDVDLLKEVKEVKRARLTEYAAARPSAEYHEGRGVWSVKCDIALPCATQNELLIDDAKALVANGCIAVCEGANMPTTLDATQYLQQNGVYFVPGKAANAGGVATSALEMSQNSERLSWTFEEVDAKLNQIMVNIYHNIDDAAKRYGKEGDYVAGANIAGFEKVVDAMLAQGVC